MSKNLKVQVREGADNKLDLAKLEDVLARKLIIPSYQRPYAWTKENIEEIFQTIGNAKDDNDKVCFFGSIILSQKENGYGQEEYYIIDGQQRLSSFLLILRVVLDDLDNLFKRLESITQSKAVKNFWANEKNLKMKFKIESQKGKLDKIIQTVNLKREGKNDESEKSILNFIKNSGNPHSEDLRNNIDKIRESIMTFFEFSDIESSEDFISVADDLMKFLDLILNKVKFVLISIEGESAEDFAINLFNTLNTTGEPLTAFEVLKSELYIIDENLSNKIDVLQSHIIQKYMRRRKKVISHTGKLLLYLPLYRGDFQEGEYSLSDKKFKDQRGYLKSVLNDESARSIVKDIESIDNFYSKYWLRSNSIEELSKKHDEQVCFQFLSELKHDRALPILIRFYEKNRESLGECVKICAAFSSLWRAFSDGGTSGVDKAYKSISDISKTSNLKNPNAKILSEELKSLFLDKLSSNDAEEAKSKWLQKLKTSPIYKNQKLCKFLLFVAFNQALFDSAEGKIRKGKGVDIFNIHYWNYKDYKTIEHIIPKSDKEFIGHIHTLGNLTLLPQALNSSLGDKFFSNKLIEYIKFCEAENKNNYPYLPVIKHIASYNKFGKEEIKERSEILAQFIWRTLAEDWLGWR